MAYAVLWAIGTAIASMADDWLAAVKSPLICAGLAGGFAYMTATGTLAVWITVLVTGLVRTLAIAGTIRLRQK